MSKANYFQFLQKLLGIFLFLISNIKEKQGKIWKKKKLGESLILPEIQFTVSVI